MATVTVTAAVSSTDITTSQDISLTGSETVTLIASDNTTVGDAFSMGPTMISIATDDAQSIVPGFDAVTEDSTPLAAAVVYWTYIRNTDDGNYVEVIQATAATTEVVICRLLAGEMMLLPIIGARDIRVLANTAVCTIECAVFQQ